MSGRWSGSTRQLPNDWQKRRAVVKRRANGKCQAEQHHPDCDGIGTDCDHIIPNDDHSFDNLQWLSGPCHNEKTQKESRAGWRRKRFRDPMVHPGLA